MNFLFAIQTLVLIFLNVNTDIKHVHELSLSEDLTLVSVCPVQNDLNHSIIEGFLTQSSWADQRAETNTEGIAVSQISVLVDPVDSSVCTSLNDTFQEALDEKNGLGEQANNITYYKAGSFYFVIISIRQSETENYISIGRTFLTVHNQNLDVIKGYYY